MGDPMANQSNPGKSESKSGAVPGGGRLCESAWQSVFVSTRRINGAPQVNAFPRNAKNGSRKPRPPE